MIALPGWIDELVRRNLAAFVGRAFSELYPGAKYDDNWHIHLIAEHLEAVYRGEERRLLITAPPRHLKSFETSVCFPAWVLGHDPSAKIICVSYSHDLADPFGAETRKLMESAWYKRVFPKTRLDPAQRSKQRLVTTRGGHRIATSVTGGLTGVGGDYLIMDDLIKAADVRSEVIRESVNSWYKTTLRSRLNNQKTGRIILVAQRLHVDDLPGQIIESGGWTHLDIPLIASQDHEFSIRGHLIERQAGNILQEERLGFEEAEELKRDVGSNLFEAQYNQRPIPDGGNIFRLQWLRYVDEPLPPHAFQYRVQSWDTAIQVAEENDYTVCVTVGVRGKEYHILDVYRGQIDLPQQMKLVPKLKQQWGADLVLIEASQVGLALAQTLQRMGHRWIETPIPRGSKRQRAEAQTMKFENGQIILPRNAPWRESFEKELIGFPGKHDDQVDAITQFLAAVDGGQLVKCIELARIRSGRD